MAEWLTFNELATKHEKWNGKPRLACVDVQHPTSRTSVDMWTYSPEPARVKGDDRPDVLLAGKNPITGGVRPGRSEVLRSLRYYLRAQSQGMTSLFVWRREAQKEEALDDLPRKVDKKPSSIRRTLELLRDGVERI